MGFHLTSKGRCPICRRYNDPAAEVCTHCGRSMSEKPPAILGSFGSEAEEPLPPARPGSPRFLPALLVACAGALIALSALLPWVTQSNPLYGRFSVSGMDTGLGAFALLLGIVTILIGAGVLTGSKIPPLLQRSPLVTGLGAGALFAIGIQRGSDVARAANSACSLCPTSVGAGIWVLGIGAALCIAGAMMLTSARPDQSEDGARDDQAPGDTTEALAAIGQLAGLRDEGAITPEEFETKKAELLKRS